MIKVTYSSIDGVRETRSYQTLARAQRFAVKMVGANPEIGGHYAISSDGVGKIEVRGAKLAEVFGIANVAQVRAGRYAVFNTWNMDEYNGSRIVYMADNEEEAILALDYHARDDHSENYHYGATWEGGRWVNWPILYNGKTAAEIMVETYPEGPF